MRHLNVQSMHETKFLFLFHRTGFYEICHNMKAPLREYDIFFSFNSKYYYTWLTLKLIGIGWFYKTAAGRCFSWDFSRIGSVVAFVTVRSFYLEEEPQIGSLRSLWFCDHCWLPSPLLLSDTMFNKSWEMASMRNVVSLTNLKFWFQTADLQASQSVFRIRIGPPELQLRVPGTFLWGTRLFWVLEAIFASLYLIWRHLKSFGIYIQKRCFHIYFKFPYFFSFLHWHDELLNLSKS